MPTVAQSLILTRVEGRASAMPPGETLANLAASETTLALHLAAAYTDRIVEELLPFYGQDCACTVVAYASRPEEQVLRCRLSDLAQAVEDAGICMTAVIFVGPGVDVAQAHLQGPLLVTSTLMTAPEMRMDIRSVASLIVSGDHNEWHFHSRRSPVTSGFMCLR